jgi:hypothetical protein
MNLPRRHTNRAVTASACWLIGAVAMTTANVQIEATPPVLVTRLETQATGSGYGLRYEEIFETYSKGIANCSEALSFEYTSDEGTGSLSATFELEEGTTFTGNVACTMDPQGQTANLFGTAMIMLEVLEDTDVQCICSGNVGPAWRIQGEDTLDLDAPYSGTLSLAAGTYTISSRMHWASMTPSHLEVTALEPDRLRVKEIFAFAEGDYPSSIDESMLITDSTGLPFESTAASSGAMSDCGGIQELAASISFVEETSLPLPVEGFEALGTADQTRNCSYGSAMFEADFDLASPHLAVWTAGYVFEVDQADLDGDLCNGNGYRLLDSGSWTFRDGGILDGSVVDVSLALVPTRIRIPEDADDLEAAITLAGTYASGIESLAPFCLSAEPLAFTIEIESGRTVTPALGAGPGVALTIRPAGGTGSFTIDAGGGSRCLDLTTGWSELTIEHAHFINGASDHGGAVRISSGTEIRFSNCTFTGNHADSNGGAIWIDVDPESTVSLEDCTIEDNEAGIEGGGIRHESTGSTELLITGTSFCDNLPDDLSGNWTDLGGNTFCNACIADLNGDETVDGQDLSVLLSGWGACPGTGRCIQDLNGDDVVDGRDLSVLLNDWGACR